MNNKERAKQIKQIRNDLNFLEDKIKSMRKVIKSKKVDLSALESSLINQLIKEVE